MSLSLSRKVGVTPLLLPFFFRAFSVGALQQPLRVTYKNWTGLTQDRTIFGASLPTFGHNLFHGTGWTVPGNDPEKGPRSFAVDGFLAITYLKPSGIEDDHQAESEASLSLA